MENLTCELNGVKYLLVEVIVIPKYEKKILEKCTKYECIAQGIKEINIKTPYAVLKVLVPESNVIAFNNEEIKKDDSVKSQNIIFLFVQAYIEMCCSIRCRIKSALSSK